jgi:hypothetical protein
MLKCKSVQSKARLFNVVMLAYWKGVRPLQRVDARRAVTLGVAELLGKLQQSKPTLARMIFCSTVMVSSNRGAVPGHQFSD